MAFEIVKVGRWRLLTTGPDFLLQILQLESALNLGWIPCRER